RSNTSPSPVPLKWQEQPHLVSLENFASSSGNNASPFQPPAGIHPAVANCFSATVTRTVGSAPPEVTSGVLAGPLDQCSPVSIPDGFIRIVNEPGANFTGERQDGSDILDGVLATDVAPAGPGDKVGTGLYISAPDPITHRCSYCQSLANFKAYQLS